MRKNIDIIIANARKIGNLEKTYREQEKQIKSFVDLTDEAKERRIGDLKLNAKAIFDNAMNESLEALENIRVFANEKANNVDLTDSKLKNAIDILTIKTLKPEQIENIEAQFKGNQSALAVIKGYYDVYNMQSATIDKYLIDHNAEIDKVITKINEAPREVRAYGYTADSIAKDVIKIGKAFGENFTDSEADTGCDLTAY